MRDATKATDGNFGTAMIGYDGETFRVGDRVEIHPDCPTPFSRERGVIVGQSLTERDRVHVVLDNEPGRKWSGSEDMFRRVD